MIQKSDITKILVEQLSEQYVNLYLDSIYIEQNEIFCTLKVQTLDDKTYIESKLDDIKKQIVLHFPQALVYISLASNTLKTNFTNNNKKSILNNNKATIEGIKHIVLVSSGKGGVGKSTLSVNLAYAFKNIGLKVGILDADVYGPSINFMMSKEENKKASVESKTLPTLQQDGIVYNSVTTFLENKNDAIVLKAPMTIKLFNQLLKDSNWGSLDILLIDMPPGTGDLHINVALNYNLSGAVIVCTPQKLALIDAYKAVNMYIETEVNIVGIVENMNSFVCPHCGKITNIFSSNGAENFAKEINASFLGSIPFSTQIREYGDDATNVIKENSNSTISITILDIAKNILKQINK